MRSRNTCHPVAQDFIPSEGSGAFRVETVERKVQPAGCSTIARAKKDGTVIWEALSVLHMGVGRSERGEPELSLDAVQGVGGLNSSDDVGERKALGPERAKAARVVVNFRRGT